MNRLLHNAPAVAYPLASPWLEPLLLSALWLGGVLSVLLWLDTTQSWTAAGTPAGVGASVSAIAGFLALAASTLVLAAQWRRCLESRHQPHRWLCWNGQDWFCGPALGLPDDSSLVQSPEPENPGSTAVVIVLDMQVLLLLRLRSPANQHQHQNQQWLWLSQRNQSAQWLDLRRALAARVRLPAV